MADGFRNSPSGNNSVVNDYDFIICGAGCAGLSLAVCMIQSGKFTGQKVLLIDKEKKRTNDHTWCFWETRQGLFENIIYRKWEKVWFYGENFSRLLELEPYQYKMIRSIDFYNFCFNLIRQHKNFEILNGSVETINSLMDDTWLVVEGKKITASYIFNSIVLEKPNLKNNEYYLFQHFKGWQIETGEKVFNPGEATLMDFRVRQQKDTRFVYTLPLSENNALVEYTVFSSALLEPMEYVEGLRDYLDNRLKIKDYRVLQEESGVIPMTNYRFPLHSGNVVHIGTAGGQTKPSSGYTFHFIQKHAEAIVKQLIKTGKPFINASKKRFHFYDSVLLNILYKKSLLGSDVFTALFQKNKPQHVLRFLDNESTLSEELKIISSLPALPFLRAAFQQLGS